MDTYIPQTSLPSWLPHNIEQSSLSYIVDPCWLSHFVSLSWILIDDFFNINSDSIIRCFYRVKVKVAQSCPTLCDPTDYTVHGILQASILEWTAFPFSRGSSQPRYQTQVSHMTGAFFTSWATGKPKNTGVGNPSLVQWIFLNQELNQPRSPTFQADSLPAKLPGKPTVLNS